MHTCKEKNCEHKRIEFCKLCQKVYCLDCGKEWPEYRDTFYPVITYLSVSYPSPTWVVIPQWTAPSLPYITYQGGNSNGL